MKINNDNNKVNTLEINPILFMYRAEFFTNEFKLVTVIVPTIGINNRQDNNTFIKILFNDKKE